jgi:flagellar basal body-associated protein FliL
MSDKTDDKAPVADKKAAPRGGAVGLVLTGLIAGGAAFGGARAAAGRSAGHAPPAPAAASHTPRVGPPGYTLALEPFLVMAADTNRRAHPMRVVLAVEFDQTVREEGARVFVSRIRDASLTYLRTITYEAASDPERMEQLRTHLLERVQSTGATGVTRVLLTDLVVQ